MLVTSTSKDNTCMADTFDYFTLVTTTSEKTTNGKVIWWIYRGTRTLVISISQEIIHDKDHWWLHPVITTSRKTTIWMASQRDQDPKDTLQQSIWCPSTGTRTIWEDHAWQRPRIASSHLTRLCKDFDGFIGELGLHNPTSAFAQGRS